MRGILWAKIIILDNNPLDFYKYMAEAIEALQETASMYGLGYIEVGESKDGHDLIPLSLLEERKEWK